MRKAVVLMIILVLSGCTGLQGDVGQGGGERRGGSSHQH